MMGTDGSLQLPTGCERLFIPVILHFKNTNPCSNSSSSKEADFEDGLCLGRGDDNELEGAVDMARGVGSGLSVTGGAKTLRVILLCILSTAQGSSCWCL